MRTVLQEFGKGFVKSLDILGTKNWPDISNEADKDYRALRRDWENVGNAIRRECEQYAGATSRK